MKDVRYHLFKLDGNGGCTPVLFDAPLQGVQLTQTLSGAGALSFTASPEQDRLSGLLEPFNTLIVVEVAGVIRGAGLLESLEVSGETISGDCTDHIGYLDGLRAEGTYSGVQIDPADAMRRVLANASSRRGFNLGLQVSSLKTPLRIGTEARDVSFETASGESVDFEAGPWTLNHFDDVDLFQELNDLASENSIDYRLKYSAQGESIRAYLELGYPSLGSFKKDAFLEVGTNVLEVPIQSAPEENYFTRVQVTGAGEGRTRIVASAALNSSGVGRVKYIEDKTLKTKTRAKARAESELKRAQGLFNIESLVLRDSQNCPLFTLEPGDSFDLRLPENLWSDLKTIRLRLLEISTDFDSGTQTLKVRRADQF